MVWLFTTSMGTDRFNKRIFLVNTEGIEAYVIRFEYSRLGHSRMVDYLFMMEVVDVRC